MMTNIQNLINSIEYIKTINIHNQIATDISNDSRTAKKEMVFTAIKGFKIDGHKFISSAIDQGCEIIIGEDIPLNIPEHVAFIQVKDSRIALGQGAKAIYDDFSHKMKLIGITGTNGKTSSTYLLQSLFENTNKKIGIIGTSGSVINNITTPLSNTTPESSEVYKLLKKMGDVDTDFAFMEVSSHATTLKRIEGLEYEIGIFTNLTEDHLIFHKTMENYYLAKKAFFDQVKTSIINIDDTYGQRLYNELSAEGKTVYSYSINKASDFKASNVHTSMMGSSFVFETKSGNIDINVKTPGDFSVYNSLGVAGAAFLSGINLESIKHGLEKIPGVPGRFEILPTNLDCTIILDFAHTPDGLEKVMMTIDQFAKGRKIVLFGAQGERDRARRGQMGDIAGRYCDLSILTEDNPVFENPLDICKEIAKAIEPLQGDYKIIVNRTEAIEYAIDTFQPNDVILLAGKSTEPYQMIKDKKIPYDEKSIALNAIRKTELRLGLCNESK